METYTTFRAAFDAAFRRSYWESRALRVEKFAGLWWVSPALTEACS